MDGQRFDSVARALGAVPTRRAVIAGLLAAVAPFAAEGKPKKKRKLGTAGPCGNGGPKANRCRKNKDCCTGICDKGAGKKHGRCRCRRRGQACTQDRNCCSRGGQELVCLEGTCQKPGACAPTCICVPECEPGRYCDPNVGSCCSAIEGPCDTASDCCVTHGDPAACSQGECVACDREGDSCTIDGTCCSEMCVDGQCACLARQETCSSDWQCCEFQTGTILCEGTCCRINTYECAVDGDCCSGICCNNECSDTACP